MPTRTHKAHGNDGRSHTIVESRSMISTDSLSGPGKGLPGLSTFQLSDGRRLNKLDDQTFQTLDGHLTLALIL
jgi:hypothetical protein